MLREQAEISHDIAAQAALGVVVVVKVKFDLAETLFGKARQRIQNARVVLLAGIKKTVPWAPAGRIAKHVGQPRVFAFPGSHAGARRLGRCLAPKRLKMIADGEK